MWGSAAGIYFIWRIFGMGCNDGNGAKDCVRIDKGHLLPAQKST